ncbi:MAG TPA: hypothetical protein VNG12_10020, partial [Acidimicrobiales bacterium]|nr:hypothetical protein [Acidimicrobiales bacterium]
VGWKAFWTMRDDRTRRSCSSAKFTPSSPKRLARAGLNGTQVLPEEDPRCPSVHLPATGDLRLLPNAQLTGGAVATFAM